MNWLTESLEPIWGKYKIEVTLVTIASLITVISGLIFVLNQKKPVKPEIPTLNKIKSTQVSKNKIFIDLSGSIEKSDVYEISSGARLKDVLILAGGLSEDADRQYFAKNYNLARILKDQEKIYIPSQEETSGREVTLNQNAFSDSSLNILGASEKVNINTGSLEQLDTLPGIGEVTAKKIILVRPYESINDLLNKKAVGKSVFEKIKDLITL